MGIKRQRHYLPSGKVYKGEVQQGRVLMTGAKHTDKSKKSNSYTAETS
jgi:hypothetical protein